MLEFKNMRQRVDFAYEQMNVDIYYEGDFKYTIEHRGSHRIFEMLSEEQVDKILNGMWSESHLAKRVG